MNDLNAVFSPALVARAEALIAACRSRGLQIATAESCTAGLVAALLTEVAGSSAVFDRGFVTYSNEAKMELLAVPAATLAANGAVSAQTAEAMARGTLARSRATLAVAITGIAGPGGGTEEKPVGLVHFALAMRDGSVHRAERRFGEIGRGAVRLSAVEQALHILEHGLS